MNAVIIDDKLYFATDVNAARECTAVGQSKKRQLSAKIEQRVD